MKKIKEVVIRRQLIQRLLKQASKCNVAHLFLLGGRENRIERVVPIDKYGGCAVSPRVHSSAIAKQMYALAKKDLDILGFSMVWPYKCSDSSTTLNHNITRWQRNHPNCYFLLIGKKSVPRVKAVQLSRFSTHQIEIKVSTRGKNGRRIKTVKTR